MSNWAHLTLDELCNFEKGTIGLASAIEGQYPLVATGAERRSSDTFQFDTAAVCIPLVSSTGHGHASLNYVHYQEGKFALGTILVAVIPKDTNVLNAQFLHLYLSRLKDIILVPLMTGAANVSLSVSKIKQVKIPVPSISEQLKVVSLFNRMDNEQSELSDEISTQQKLLKELRQAILQEAIEGKLSGQWRKENSDIEPASKLFEKIRGAKDRLIQEKKIKKDKPLPKINEDEVPFNVPNTWIWTRLDEVSIFTNGKAHEQYVDDNGQYILINSKFISTNCTVKKYASKLLTPVRQNDICIVMSDVPGGRALSRCFLVDKNDAYTLNQRIGGITPIEVFPKYLKIILDRNQYYINFDDLKKQTNLKKDQILSCPVALPPYEEQKIIVEKIETLFVICDEIEQQISESKVNIEILMQVVLQEAFE